MIKALINLGSLLVCLGILAFGGYQTVQNMQIDEMIGDFESAIESTPLIPGLPDSGEPDSPDNPDSPDGPDAPAGDSGILIPEGSDAILDEDTVLEVEDVEEELSQTVYDNLDEIAGDGMVAELVAAYDISLLLDGAAVQPGGTVEITLDIPEGVTDTQSLAVVYIDDNGNVTLCDTTVNGDGTLSFLTDHFSRYAIISITEAHEHIFIEGKCECGEINPNYIPPHTHEFVEGECACGESDPDYVPPHVHKYVEGVCSCGEKNPNYAPDDAEHTHSFVEGECACGESDPNYVPPHVHKYVEGVCSCGEKNPNYVPPHVHSYVNGKCECGESDPTYVAHKHSYVNGKCECGESDPDYKAPGLSNEEAKDSFSNMYDSYDPDFKELNKEFFMGMVSGALGTNSKPVTKPEHTHSYVDGKCECGETDPNYNPDGSEAPDEPVHTHSFVNGVCECGETDPTYTPDFGDGFDAGFDDDFNAEEFVPEEAPEGGDSGTEETVNDLIVDVAGTYFDKLQEGIEQNQKENENASEAEQQAARDEFVQKEADAFAGLLNIVTKPEESTEQELVDSVDAILNSSVCLGTVTESVENNEALSSTVQDATSNLDVATKNDIQQKIEEQLEANPENEKQYNDLANLFGITLGSSGEVEIPGDVELPEGFDPDQLPESNG